MINAAANLAERHQSKPIAWKGVRGDMNGDGSVDSFDITPFNTAVGDMAAYHTTYPDLDGHARADINDDGTVDSFDTSAFNALLSGDGDQLESAPTLRSYRSPGEVTLNDLGHQGLPAANPGPHHDIAEFRCGVLVNDRHLNAAPFFETGAALPRRRGLAPSPNPSACLAQPPRAASSISIHGRR